MEETEDICDRVAFIRDGRVIKTGTTEELKRTGKERYALCLLTTAEELRSITRPSCFASDIVSISPAGTVRDGKVVMTVEIKPGGEHISDVIEFLVGHGIRIESCERRKKGLHQLFAGGPDE